MGRLLSNIFGWLISKAGLLAVLVISLMFAPSVMRFVDAVGRFDPKVIVQDIDNWSSKLAPGKNSTQDEVKQKLEELRRLLARKSAERDEVKLTTCVLPTCSLEKTARLYRVELEVTFLAQAIVYADAIRASHGACDASKQKAKEVATLQNLVSGLNLAKPFWAPVSQAHQNLIDQLQRAEEDLARLQKLCSAYNRLSDVFKGNKSLIYDEKFREPLNKILSLKDAQSLVMASATEVLPSALLALLGIIFMPIVVSAISFYGLAPLASRRPGVQLLPGTSGNVSNVSGSERLQHVDLEPGWELLIDPALVNAAPKSATKKTKVLLDWTMPLSSIIAGLYLMTRIRSEARDTITIAAKSAQSNRKDMNNQESSRIAIIDLPDDSALVLQPRCLVGIVQSIERPIRITRHWRLGKLSSWLTMQLRYIVFHGPAKLIVRGNDGVNLAIARQEVSINQSATLGFSANLNYAVARCDTFYAYLSGKKELFDDSFSSGPGYFIQEVSPVLVTGGPLRRPWEVLINAILKAFGLG